MKQLHLIYHDTYASGLTAATSELDDAQGNLALGAFCVFDATPGSSNENISIDAANASAPACPNWICIVTNSKAGLKKTGRIAINKARIKKLAKADAVAKVMRITEPSGVTPQAGDLVGVLVSDLTKPMGSIARDKWYTVEVNSSSTWATIITALYTKIGADANAIVTATDGTTYLQLTAKTAGNNFVVSGIGIFGTGAVTIDTNLVYPQGGYAAIRALEIEDAFERGLKDGQEPQSEYYNIASDISATTKQYQTYILEYEVENPRPVGDAQNELQTIIFALDASLTLTDTATKSVKGLEWLVTKIGATALIGS